MSKKKTKPASTVFRRGSEILKAADEDRKNRETSGGESSYDPTKFRFKVKNNESADIIVLDSSIEDSIAFFEHNTKDPNTGFWGSFKMCIAETAYECPLCAEKKPTYVLFLTVLDKRGYQPKNGKKVPYTKRLLALKGDAISDFKKLEVVAQKKGNTLRGMCLTMERGSDQKSLATGSIQMQDNGSLFSHISESKLKKKYGHPQVKSKDGDKIYREKNEDIQPFDYTALFKEPDEAYCKKLLKEFGEQAQDDYSDDDDEPKPKKKKNKKSKTHDDVLGSPKSKKRKK